MATYESVSSAQVDDSNSLTITKPTGLAEGDLMIAGVVTDRDSGGGTPTMNTPSGWTLDEAISMTGAQLAIFSKIADSGDVAASNFTFTSTTVSGQFMIGHIVRLSSPGTKRGDVSGQTGASGTTTSITGFTPTASASHVGFVYRAFGTAVTVTSLAYATDDPSFTERAESGVDGTTIDGRLAVYSASRSQTTATGNITATFGASDNTRTAIAVIAWSSQLSGSISQETKLNAYALSPIPSSTLNAIVETPQLTSSADPNIPWTNKSKPNTTWTQL